MSFSIREMTIADYDAVIALWQSAEGVGLSRADERPAIAAYLERNPGHSFVAEQNGQIIGAVLCGHDGRRGYLHHLAVHPQARRQGLGQALAQRCMDQLKAIQIDKCHIFVFKTNTLGQAFWSAANWKRRDDLVIMSMEIDGSAASSAC